MAPDPADESHASERWLVSYGTECTRESFQSLPSAVYSGKKTGSLILMVIASTAAPAPPRGTEFMGVYLLHCHNTFCSTSGQPETS